MSQFLSAQAFVIVAIVLIVVNRWVTNRWLAEHARRHGRLPGSDWWQQRDPDPTLERWRRLRIVVLVPTLGAFVTAFWLLVTSR